MEYYHSKYNTGRLKKRSRFSRFFLYFILILIVAALFAGYQLYKVILKPNLEAFRGVWGFHDQLQKESWHKTDSCNVESEIWLEDHSAI